MKSNEDIKKEEEEEKRLWLPESVNLREDVSADVDETQRDFMVQRRPLESAWCRCYDPTASAYDGWG